MSRCAKPGDHTAGRPIGERFDHPDTVHEQIRIATKLVDQKTLDHGRVIGGQNGPGSHNAGDDTAFFDIPHEADRHARAPRKPHIGDVPVTEIDFRRASCAFDQDQVMGVDETLEALHDAGHQAIPIRHIIGSLESLNHAPVNHHLSRPVAFRFQQNRVEIHMGVKARCPGLKRLGAADLPAVGTSRRVVGHVLGLEGRDAQPPSFCDTAECGRQNGLAHIRPRPLDHQGTRRHKAPSISILVPSIRVWIP